MNAHIILAADAHDPQDVAENLRLAEAFARDLGINYDADYQPKFFNQWIKTWLSFSNYLFLFRQVKRLSFRFNEKAEN